MENGFLVISEKGFGIMTDEEKQWAIFNTLKSIDARLKTLEKRPFVDKCWSFAGGIVGGAAAALGIKWGG